MHNKIQELTNQLESGDTNIYTICIENLTSEDKNDFKYLMYDFASNPKAAANIQSFTCTGAKGFEFEQDYVMNLSIFPSLTKISIIRCGLVNYPYVELCTNLKSIYLGMNKIHELANIEDFSKLRIVDLSHNPLSENTIKQLKRLYPATRSGRGGIILNFSEETHEIPSIYSDNELASMSMEQLIQLFVVTVDMAKKNDSTLADLLKIGGAFVDKLPMHSDNNRQSEFARLLAKCNIDSLYQSKFKFLMMFCRMFYDDNCPHKRWPEEDMPKHYTSNEVWLPDFSFLSKFPPEQTPIGKERHVDYKPPFPRGLLLAMQLSYWYEDCQYLYTSEKKRLKARKTEQPFILIRDIDQISGLTKIPSGYQPFAISLNGGLLVGSLEEESTKQHSYFRAGQYVICAGNVMLNEQGKITYLDGGSGHMTPSRIHVLCTAIYLFKHKLIDNDCLIRSITPRGSSTYGMPYEKYCEIDQVPIKAILANLDAYVEEPNIIQFIQQMMSAPEQQHSNTNRTGHRLNG